MYQKMSHKVKQCLWCLMMLAICTFAVPVITQAASAKEIDYEACKIGTNFYKMSWDENTNSLTVQRSKYKNKDYKNLLTLSSSKVSGSMYCDGKVIYYTSNNAVYSYSISSKKTVKLASVTVPKTFYLSIHCINGSNMYLMAGKIKYQKAIFYCFNTKSKKVKKLITVDNLWNETADDANIFYTKPSSGNTMTVYAYNLETGKKRLVAQKVTSILQYAAGGSGYDILAKYEGYGIYSKSKKTMTVYEYSFATGKSKKLTTFKNVPATAFLMLGSDGKSEGIVLNDYSKGWMDFVKF